MSQQAADAIKAAKNRYNWGVYATHRFLSKRNVPVALYSLALNLEMGYI